MTLSPRPARNASSGLPAAENLFREPLWDGCLVAGKGFEVIFCSFAPGASGTVSFAALDTLLSGRDEAIAHGLEICGEMFEVYQHGPTDAGDMDLVYGRRADSSKGFCLARHRASGLYGLVTFSCPVLSPEAIPPLVRALRECGDARGRGGSGEGAAGALVGEES